MTYLAFHAYLIGPAVLLVLIGWLCLERWGPSASCTRVRAEIGALGLLVGIAFCYTLPWDHLLIRWEVWRYEEGRIWATLWGIPVEECAFFILQTILAGSWYAVVVRLRDASTCSRFQSADGPAPGGTVDGTGDTQMYRSQGRVRSGWGGVVGGIVTVLGLGLVTMDRSFYLGMILLWSGPVLGLQWGIYGWGLWRLRWTIGVAVTSVSLYLWMADRVALRAQIWHISSEYTVGVAPFGLPVEEALFFLVTSLLVVQGMVMLTDPGGEPSSRGWSAR